MITFKKFLENLEPGIELHTELNTLLWDNYTLKEDVRSRLLSIADKFIDYLAISDEAIEDIIFVGGNCSFAYTKFSDIDLHLVIDTKTVACPDCPGENSF
jgi:hypothetical protein